jgi:uncharacterized membrane protein YfcA
MGIGGGAILIPALVIFAKPEQHIAQSVNLLFFIPTAVVALFIHIRNRQVRFKLAWPLILCGIAGAVAGSLIAIAMPGKILRRVFGIYLLLMGAYEVFFKSRTKDSGQKETKKRLQK